ncbi:MAG: SCO family protein [Deltaproteobacteria bacterium]|nr:SCO family protein [Deltaproteobacteria bacterium]
MRVVFTMLLVSLVACGRQTAPPPAYGRLPAFDLVAESGRAFGSADLAHKVWIANFIFTRCPTICPAFSAKMALVQKKIRSFGGAVQLVSFSVDPEYDTPPRLQAYAARYGADQALWTFLTGPLDEIKAVVKDGLKVAMGKQEGGGDDVAAIFHGTYFVVLDADMQIRGYVDSNDATAVQQVVALAGRVVAGGG